MFFGPKSVRNQEGIKMECKKNKNEAEKVQIGLKIDKNEQNNYW